MTSSNAGELAIVDSLVWGDTNDRGDEPNEMGDMLLAVDLGMGRTVKMLAAGDRSYLRYFGQ